MGRGEQAQLQDFGNGAYAWVAPLGTWGWSNAGLIVDSGESPLVDTLFAHMAELAGFTSDPTAPGGV